MLCNGKKKIQAKTRSIEELARPTSASEKPLTCLQKNLAKQICHAVRGQEGIMISRYVVFNLVPRALFPSFPAPPPKPGKSAMETRLMWYWHPVRLAVFPVKRWFIINRIYC